MDLVRNVSSPMQSLAGQTLAFNVSTRKFSDPDTRSLKMKGDAWSAMNKEINRSSQPKNGPVVGADDFARRGSIRVTVSAWIRRGMEGASYGLRKKFS